MSTAPSAAPMNAKPGTEIALVGAGCFWGVEHIFAEQDGIINAISGYSGGHVENPTYKQICTDMTGHAEVVQVTFDPAKISYEQVIDIFFRLHDPTQINRQGPDIGTQYRSVIYYYNDEQKAAAQRVKDKFAPRFKRPIATAIEPAKPFYIAEDYHQDYYVKTGKEPYCHVLRDE
ncbi:MAG: peptide-methionine (S)-S-oxide reductase MsrA [Phycisphaerae bacterium]